MSKSLRPIWGIVTFLCAVVAVSLLFRALRPKEIIPWRTDFAAATDEARQSNKPVLAYFTADWCPPCQELKSTTWADKNVEAALRDYVPVKIDIDRRDDLAGEYHVPAVPAYIILGADGKTLRRTDGALPPEEFLKWLKS